MDSSLDNLYRLTMGDVPKAARMCARAFFHYPFQELVVPDEEFRAKHGELLYAFNYRLCIKHGELYGTSEKLEGVAGWVHSSVNFSIMKLLRTGVLKLFKVAGLKLMRKIIQIDAYCNSRRKKVSPANYMHLLTLAVDPEEQGKGHVSSLLLPMFSRLDDEGLPCVVETQTEQNASMYKHLGFEVMDESIIPGTPIKNTLFIRTPR
ncbi:MAG: GNAT family N-acetyltransferase [Candidatus Hodarchaeota archaeon]